MPRSGFGGGKNLSLACGAAGLRRSSLIRPSLNTLSHVSTFSRGEKGKTEQLMIPGEILTQDGNITLNADRASIALRVANSGDRPIQVGSHYHFFETNPALQFDRARARGMRLDIPAGTAMRFEPGQTREVRLVAYAGTRVVHGFRGEVMGEL